MKARPHQLALSGDRQRWLDESDSLRMIPQLRPSDNLVFDFK